MRLVVEPARAGGTAPTMIVLLPAAYSSPEDFVSAGFVAAARRRELDVDLVFAGLELTHVTDRAALERLHEELILPARARRCAVWLGGISLGAYIALCCAERYAQDLNGLCLFAPYLGSHIVTGEIERAGGLKAWSPGMLAEDDEERRVWRFIKTQGARSLPLTLGLGRDDRFAPRHRLLAAALDPAMVDTVPGGHDWPTWLQLWERFLARIFPRASSHSPA
jgi:pimeloyl-ACP methyl ester carboxylesterase